MSNDNISNDNISNDNKSDLQQAAEQVDSEQVKKNLAQDQSSDTPKNLNEKQKTPFIDEQSRTDS